jgi:hypothetical protein
VTPHPEAAVMRFESILFEQPGVGPGGPEEPDYFADLNLDQVLKSMTAGREQYDLAPFFCTPLHEADAVRYRHEVLRDLEKHEVLESVNGFAEKMRRMRQHLEQAQKLHYKLQKQAWFLDAAGIYRQAVRVLAEELAGCDVTSRGFGRFCRYLAGYAASEPFTSLTAETAALKEALARVRYSVRIHGPRVTISSVENTGLIITGFGVALTGASVGNQRLVAIGLLAATLQMVTHTAAKSLLFSSAAGLEAVAGSDDLEVLRGMGRRAPWSSTGLAVGALTLAGLPPTAGFVSEWFLLESLMQQFRVTPLGGRLTLALAGAAVALTAGFAGVTFVRLVGLVVLGPAGPDGSRRGEYGWAGRGALALLAASPLVIAALTPLEIRVIAAGLSPVVPGQVTTGALKSPWVLQPVFAGFSILSPSWLWIELPVMLALVILLTFALSGRRLVRVRRVPAWRSATIGVDGADSYTPFGYANPTRRVLASVLHTRAGVEELDPRRSGAAEGHDDARVPHLRYTSDVVEVVESWLYRPAALVFAAVVRAAKRLQSGRLDAYLLYMLIALVAVVAVVTATA